MGKIMGTAPSQISGSVGLYTFRQTKDGTVIKTWAATSTGGDSGFEG